MDAESFKPLYENLDKNLKEIKEVIKKPKLLEFTNSAKILEKLKYLFYSATKSLVDIGHSIILENDLRDPLNRADIFISLAERDIVMSSVVPGVKKAVLALSKMNNYQPPETLKLISDSIEDLHKCLDSFVVYFDLKDKQF